MTVRRGARVGVALVVALLVGVATPAGAADEAGTLSVSPSTDLVDDQVVQVTGEGWPPGRFLVIVQCDARADDFGGCDQTAGTIVKDHDGSFTVELEVERGIDTAQFGTLDCASAPGACVVAAFHRPGRLLAATPISFDPEGPPPTPPFELEVDVARDVRLAPDGERALVDIRLDCRPGMHVVLFASIAQDNGEEDAFGFGEGAVRRCNGETFVQVEVRAFDGELDPGHAVLTVEAFGFRDRFDPDEFASDLEFLRVSLGP